MKNKVFAFRLILTLTLATVACGGDEADEPAAAPTAKKRSDVQILGKSTPYKGEEKKAAEHMEVKKKEEPKVAEKAAVKRAYSAVGTMDK